MSRFIILTKLMFKSQEGVISSKSKQKKIIYYIFLTILLMPLMTMIYKGTSVAYDFLKLIGNPEIIISVGFAIACLLIFIFGIFNGINILYFSKDTENLIYLPFTPKQIISAKLFNILIYEYLMEAVIFIPILIAYGMKSSSGSLFYITGIIVFFILPIVPIAFSTLIVMLMMSFTKFAKNKDRFKKISGVLILIMWLGINMYFQIGGHSNENQIKSLFANGGNPFIKGITNVFYQVKFAVKAITINDISKVLLNLGIFIAITIVAIIITLILSEKLYFRGLLGSSEISSSRRVLTSEELEKSFKTKGIMHNYVKKELKTLMRVPAYFQSCIVTNFIFPILMLGGFILGSLNNKNISLQSISELINKPKILIMIIIGSSILSILTSNANYISSTGISREGKELFVYKYLPVPFKKIVYSKIITSIILTGLAELIIITSITIIFKIKIIYFIMMCIVAFLSIAFMSAIGILIDLRKPKIKWESEVKAIKNNINSLFSFLFGLAISAVIIYSIIKLKLSVMNGFIALFILFIVLNLIVYSIINSKAESMFKKIDI